MYAALLTFCDAQLGRVLDLFDRHNMWQDTMLIVNTECASSRRPPAHPPAGPLHCHPRSNGTAPLFSTIMMYPPGSGAAMAT